jgi:hypothetical protein
VPAHAEHKREHSRAEVDAFPGAARFPVDARRQPIRPKAASDGDLRTPNRQKPHGLARLAVRCP